MSLVYSESGFSKSSALRREAEIKALGKPLKEKLVAGTPSFERKGSK